MSTKSFFYNLSRFSPLLNGNFKERFSSSGDIQDDNIFTLIIAKISIIEIVLTIIGLYFVYINKNGFKSFTSLLFAIITALLCTPCLLVYMLFFFKK